MPATRLIEEAGGRTRVEAEIEKGLHVAARCLDLLDGSAARTEFRAVADFVTTRDQ